MAKIEPVLVSAPTSGQTNKAGSSAVTALSGAAARGNVSGQTTQLAGLLELLLSGGAQVLDPTLRAEFASLQKSVSSATKGPLKEIGTLQTTIARLESRPKLTKKQQATLSRAQAKVERLQAQVDKQNSLITDFRENKLAGAPTATDLIREKFPELGQTLADAAPYLERMGQAGVTGERLLQALGQGYQANDITSRDVQAAQMGPIADVRAQQVQASRMGDFGQATSRNITAGQVGQGTLGQALMNRAMSGIEAGGRLSPEAARDAVQSTRQAFASRGLGTSGAAIGTELLNRDRYRRQREMEDLQFASGVQAQDLGRQFQNVGNTLTADQASLAAFMQAELANLEARYNAAVQNGDWQQAAAIANQAANLQADTANQTTAFNTNSFNTQQGNLVSMSNADRSLNASIANEEARRLGNQQNIGMLGQAFTTDRMLNQEGLGAALQMGQLQGAANPFNMLFSMYSSGNPTGSESIGAGASLAGNWANNMLNAGIHNSNATMWANSANQYGNYGGQSGGVGSTLASVGLGLAGGAAGYFASGGNPLFAMGGYQAGSQLGGGLVR